MTSYFLMGLCFKASLNKSLSEWRRQIIAHWKIYSTLNYGSLKVRLQVYICSALIARPFLETRFPPVTVVEHLGLSLSVH